MVGRRMALVIPILAVVIVGVLFYASYGASAVAMRLQTALVMKITYYNGTEFLSRDVVLPPNIGVPGGILASSRYLTDGVGGFYPLYTSFPPCVTISRDVTCTIHVQSRIVRSYTLGDFFDVWGQPLGRDQTLNYTASPPTVKAPFFWDMCVHDPVTGRNLPSEDWGAHVLNDGEIIVLLFSQIGCA